jgi:methylmalonyl-CoA/ethylmalonyl-CoA epimerase
MLSNLSRKECFMKIAEVDHVAVAVTSIAAAAKLFIDLFGGKFISGGDDERLGIRTVQVQLPGMKIELMEPLNDDSFLHAYLAKRGQGFHHMTIFVVDLEQAIVALKLKGYEVVDTRLENPAWRETYVRPSSGFGTLLQIVETNRRWDLPFDGVTLDAVLAGDVVWDDDTPILRQSAHITDATS